MLVNNAGLGLPTLFANADPDQLDRQLAVNLVAPLMLTRLCLPSLIERRGMIINIGSAITCVANSALGAYGAYQGCGSPTGTTPCDGSWTRPGC